jgi:cytochrome c-type biogenesis protein
MSLLIGRFLGFYSRFRKHLHTLEVCSGVFLVVFGVLILTRHFAVLSSYLGFLNRFTL